MSEVSNPHGEEMTVDSAVESLLQPQKATEEEETEAPQEAPPPEVEDEAEEVEAEAESEVDETEVEEEPEEPAKYTVKIDGLESEVTLDELINGYQRDADYRQKTQATAEERRQLEAQRATMDQMRERYEAELQRLAQSEEQEPDWVVLAREDPLGWPEAKAEWDAKQRERTTARQALERAQAQRTAEAQQQCVARLVETIPGWKDETTRVNEYKAMMDTAIAFGFGPQEVDQATDPRIFQMVHALMKARTQPVKPQPKPKPKALTPGAKPGKSASVDGQRKALDKLRRTGSVDDAVALLLGGS